MTLPHVWVPFQAESDDLMVCEMDILHAMLFTVYTHSRFLFLPIYISKSLIYCHVSLAGIKILASVRGRTSKL